MKRRRKPVVYLDIETRYDGPVYVIPHNTAKALVGDVVRGAFHDAKVSPGMSIQVSLMGPDEYAMRKLPKVRKKIDDARIKLPKRHAFRYMRDSND